MVDYRNNSRIAKNTLFLYIRMFFVLIVTLYTSRVVLQILGVVDFGVYNVVGGFVALFAFLNSSLTGAIQRYYNFERSKRGEEGVQQVYKSSIIIQSSLATIVIILLEAIGVWYVNNVMVIPIERLVAANILFQVSVTALVLLIMSIPYSSAIVSFEYMNYYAYVGIADVILKLAIVLVLPYIQYDKLLTYSCLLFGVSVANFFLYAGYAKYRFKALKYQGPLDKELIKSMLSFSGWNFFGTFSNVVYQQGVNLLLNFFFGPIVNAARGLSNYIYSAVQGFATNIVMAFRPQLVEAYAQGNYSRSKTIMYSEAKISYLMLFILSTPICIEIDYILHLWLGPIIPEHTQPFAVLIIIQMLIVNLNVPFSQIVHASGIMRNFQIVTGGITCLIIPLGWIALKLGLPAESVFIVAIALAFVSQIACIYLVDKIFHYGKKDYLCQVILPILFVTILSPIIPLGIHSYMPSSFVRLVIVTLFSCLMICIIGFCFLLNISERTWIKDYIFKTLRK